MSKKVALGRGLSALLSDTPSEEKLEVEVAAPNALSEGTSGINEIPVAEIETNPFQPRQYFDEEALNELAESIKVHGIIQPITVRRLARHQYQLISGERRFQASKRAGLQMIPAYVRTADDQQMLEMALIENIQRENLNPVEIALSYQRLISECNLKQEELGERVGKNRSTVTNYLRLLKLPPDIQIALRDNKLSMGHARAIINVENPDSQLYIFKKTLQEDLSVRKVEELARDVMAGHKESAKQKETTAASKEITQLQGKLSSHFGTKVSVKSDGKKGDIRIPFLSIEDLNRILEILRL
ncbi:MAG: ParB/RepB/Spo0J family partition protein [Bacteroidota bacterium]|jgi:ParB family chromosome partitioning protein|nr:ParB/RepB/Spo0J family partition protein [Bacteroidota bacterium]MCA4899347.1 ParB/RepB/Spo0J family partition protein [Cytophagales bacterium]MCE2956745.1 ParB/RepB/Spo0J family partition protein [Flammeovirgaceae bacterium]MCZ8070823.1 ParB/RepB/Spo0J family partition protein [Cytophagales bacterium]